MIKPKFLTKIVPNGCRIAMRCPSCRSKTPLVSKKFSHNRDEKTYFCSSKLCYAKYHYEKKRGAYSKWEISCCEYYHYVNENEYLYLEINFRNNKSYLKFEQTIFDEDGDKNYDTYSLENTEKIKFTYKVSELKLMAHKMKNRMLFR